MLRYARGSTKFNITFSYLIEQKFFVSKFFLYEMKLYGDFCCEYTFLRDILLSLCNFSS